MLVLRHFTYRPPVSSTAWVLASQTEPAVVLDELSLTTVIPAPIIEQSSTATPDSVTSTTTMPAVTLTSSTVAVPSSLNLVATISAVSASVSIVATPTTISRVTLIPVITVRLGTLSTPATVLAATTIGQASTGGSVTANPSTIARTVAIANPGMSSTATPGTLNLVAVIPLNNLVRQILLTASVTMPSVTVRSGLGIDTVHRNVVISAVTVNVGGIVQPSLIQLVTVIPAHTIHIIAAYIPSYVTVETSSVSLTHGGWNTASLVEGVTT